MDKFDIIIILNIVIVLLLIKLLYRNNIFETFDDNKQYTTYYDVDKNIKL